MYNFDFVKPKTLAEAAAADDAASHGMVVLP